MPDLLEEAKRLSEQLKRALDTGNVPLVLSAEAWKLIPELVERLEQAERALDEISGLTIVGSQVWEIANASLEALAAQREVEDGTPRA